MGPLRAKQLLAASVLTVCMSACGATLASAQSFSSGTFTAQNAGLNSFGGTATSASFYSIGSGGQTASNEANSTSFIVDAGQLYFDTFMPRSGRWRWYDDETAETPVVPLEAEDTAPINIEYPNVIKLRLTIRDISGYSLGSAKFRLQYSTSSSFAESTHDVDEISQCSGSSVWCYANGAGTDGVKITTALLSDADACVASVGNGCGTHNTSGTSTTAFTHPANAAAEYEFTLQESGASPNTVYFFRAVDVAASTSVPLAASSSYPSLSTGGSTLSFTIDGLPAATTTSGVTTNVDTSSTDVPFGTLPLGASVIGAHRLTVSTNAAQGYRIYAFQRQGFLNEVSGEIPPVDASNASPLSWGSACAATSSGCYGYHSSADVLAGGSTRFAANDTYARFESNPYEVAYSAAPVSSKSTDMVYRVEVRDTQESGSYSTDLVYVVTPVF